MNAQDDLLPRLQALLTHWDEMAVSAARKVERFENPTAGAYFAGVMFSYEDCADDLARLLKEVLAAEVS
jgi:hypothetical protein